MNPISCLLVLSLAGQLDSPRFAVRESAQLTMQSQPFAACWPAVYTLAVGGKPEASERANRWIGRQETLFAEQWMWYAVNDPVETKPWRRVDEIERSQKSRLAWGEIWGPVLAKYLNVRPENWDGYWCGWGEPDGTGHLAAMTFQIRKYGSMQGYYGINPGDW